MAKTRQENTCPHCHVTNYTVFYTPSGLRCQKCYKSEFLR